MPCLLLDLSHANEGLANSWAESPPSGFSIKKNRAQQETPAVPQGRKGGPNAAKRIALRKSCPLSYEANPKSVTDRRPGKPLLWSLQSAAFDSFLPTTSINPALDQSYFLYCRLACPSGEALHMHLLYQHKRPIVGDLPEDRNQLLPILLYRGASRYSEMSATGDLGNFFH